MGYGETPKGQFTNPGNFFEKQRFGFRDRKQKNNQRQFFSILWELELVPGVSSFVVLLAGTKILTEMR